ncbi:MAG: RecX family transcriptional regulator [Candidatus Nomurabacteria bacterium]|jgi:regulatory protein|nr:RecX family transcriptional regulator [Candidatus Nomurabacteria bacterium]
MIETIGFEDEVSQETSSLRKITTLTAGVKDKNRVNVFLGGRFAFSLLLSQVVDNGLKVGLELSEEDEARLRGESDFGKVYQRALEWALLRPHSERELAEYLYKKTRPSVRSGKDKAGNFIRLERKGVDAEVVARVQSRILEKGYVDDEKFARWFVENRRVRKGASRKKLLLELASKGISRDLAERALIDLAADGNGRDEKVEMAKIIAKKRAKYDDDKLVQYLVRQGFNYSDVREAVSACDE